MKMNLAEFTRQLNEVDANWNFFFTNKDLRFNEYRKYLADPSGYEFPSFPSEQEREVMDRLDGTDVTFLLRVLQFFAVISVVVALVLCVFYWPSTSVGGQFGLAAYMLSITLLAAGVLQAVLLLSVKAILSYLRQINAKLKRNS